MNKTVIIIPSRLDAQRLPNKPLKLINNKEMILHVYDAAKKSDVGDVLIATPDKKIVDLIQNFGGKAILTAKHHQTGTDRVFEVFKNTLKSNPNIIVNLQGDMPNINPNDIKYLIDWLGWKWSEKYLSPQKSKRSVFTASSAQVRKKINSHFSGYWKNYEDLLKPISKLFPTYN